MELIHLMNGNYRFALEVPPSPRSFGGQGAFGWNFVCLVCLVCLVYLVSWVYLVYLVCLVCLVSLVSFVSLVYLVSLVERYQSMVLFSLPCFFSFSGLSSLSGLFGSSSGKIPIDGFFQSFLKIYFRLKTKFFMCSTGI